MDLKIICYVDNYRTNFGDDLNRWLWRRVLGFTPDVDDGTILLGIGTVITRGLIPVAERYLVLSSGVSYGALPLDFGGPKWEILSVRGPLTAAVLNLPPEKGIIDGAAMLRLLPECEPLPVQQRDGIVFMPHYESVPVGNWKNVCEMAGFEFLDPLADSEQTVQRIRKAKLVIADAMHAAIVADALRVPWIPVVLGPQNNTFKWLDWTLSLNLPYNPVKLPASTLLESVRNRTLRFYGPAFFFEDRRPSNAMEQCRRLMRLKAWKHWPLWSGRAMQITYSVPKRVIHAKMLARFKARQDEIRTQRAVEKLRQVAAMPSYLSDDRVFMSKLEQIAGLLPRLKSYVSGAPGA
jgi:succinoglycan biosynthesis protein ExoV